MRLFIALFSGLLFGLGLMISGMSNPAKVIGFLDIFGNFDPSLLFVLGGAVSVFALGYFIVIKPRSHSILGEKYDFPTQKTFDARLIIGASIFGVGWGITGICPGPAFTQALINLPSIGIFLVTMFLGFWLSEKL